MTSELMQSVQAGLVEGIAIFLKVLLSAGFWLSVSWLFVAKLRYFTGNASRHFQMGISAIITAELLMLLNQGLSLEVLGYASYTFTAIGMVVMTAVICARIRYRVKPNTIIC
ncbi:hypothetical protein F7U66_00245 [Vibrio parahaemolyticus]|nr:hypothetical protein [Vibrio parahaemolyticus]